MIGSVWKSHQDWLILTQSLDYVQLTREKPQNIRCNILHDIAHFVYQCPMYSIDHREATQMGKKKQKKKHTQCIFMYLSSVSVIQKDADAILLTNGSVVYKWKLRCHLLKDLNQYLPLLGHSTEFSVS